MAITYRTVTGNLADLLRTDFVATSLRITVRTNLDAGDAPVDLTNGQILLGTGKVTVASDGTFTTTNVIDHASTDVNPTGIQYRWDIEYTPRNAQRVTSWSSGYVSVTADADLSDLVAEQYVPPTYQSAFIEQAEGYLAQQEQIAGLANSDAAQAYNVDHGPLTGAALAASIGRKVPRNVLQPLGANDHIQIRDAGLSSNKVIELGQGTFAWDGSPATFGDGVTLRGQGVDKTFIQLAAGVTAGPCWSGTKTQVGGDNPISTVTAGSKTLTTGADLRASLAVGDVITVTSGAAMAQRDQHTEGEMAQIAAITSTTITLQAPLEQAYATGDTIRIYKLVLVAAARIEGLTILAHPAATVRQTLYWMRWADRPTSIDVKVSGDRATIGGEFQECRNPRVIRPRSVQIKDLANATLNTWTGYGTRFRGCVNGIVVDADDYNSRHAFDDSSVTDTTSGIREIPSLRTHIKGGIARECVSAGWSTHGGSRRIFLDGPRAVNCGGGFVVRGPESKGRNLVVDGVKNPASDEYSVLGGDLQSYKHGLTVGEGANVGTTGGIVSPAGVGLDMEFTLIDMTGADSTCNAISGEYADWKKSRVKWGAMVLSNDASGFVARFTDNFRDVQILGGTVTNTGTSRAVYIEARVSGDGKAPQNVLVEGLDVDGYNTAVVDIVGNQSPGANASKGIVIRRNRARNKNAAYGVGSSVWRLQAGWFDTSAAGSMQIIDNEALESNASGIKVDAINGAAGPGSGMTQHGNRSSAGYDGVLGRKVGVPSTATSAGVQGQWAADASWLYICTAFNTWRRVAIASW